MSGWGLTNPTAFSIYLYKVTLPVVQRPVCTKKWHSITPTLTIKAQHICAGTNDKGFCVVKILELFCKHFFNLPS